MAESTPGLQLRLLVDEAVELRVQRGRSSRNLQQRTKARFLISEPDLS
jgi:hypothetical protein